MEREREVLPFLLVHTYRNCRRVTCYSCQHVVCQTHVDPLPAPLACNMSNDGPYSTNILLFTLAHAYPHVRPGRLPKTGLALQSSGTSVLSFVRPRAISFLRLHWQHLLARERENSSRKGGQNRQPRKTNGRPRGRGGGFIPWGMIITPRPRIPYLVPQDLFSSSWAPYHPRLCLSSIE